MRHVMAPGLFERAVRPEDIHDGGLRIAVGGARAAGAHADALVLTADDEVNRRAATGLGAVTSLPLLDALMTLPAGYAVRVDDLGPRTRGLLQQAPPGVVVFDGNWVLRQLVPPAVVVAAVVRSHGWRRPLSRVGHFAGFAQQILVLPAAPRAGDAVLWEATICGIGVWVCAEGVTRVLLDPAPLRPVRYKAAAWRFAERAWRALRLSASARPVSSNAAAGRPPTPALEASGLPTPG